MIEQLIKHMAQYAKLEDSIQVERFEATLNQIQEMRDPRAIGLLIPFLDDNCEFYEVMYSILHAIESFDHATFVREILKSLPEFWQRSPYWATVIHTSILNTPAALDIYRSEMLKAPTAVKEASKAVLTKIRDTKPQFRDRCDGLLDELVRANHSSHAAKQN